MIIQYLPGSLIEHIGTGRAYDFDTTNRTFKLMPPFVGMGKTEWFRGTADAIYQNMNFIQDTRADLVLVLSGDHVYSMDYGPLIAQHREHNADLTIVTTSRPPKLIRGFSAMFGAGPTIASPTSLKNLMCLLTIPFPPASIFSTPERLSIGWNCSR